MTIENIRINDEFTYAFDEGRVLILKDNQLIASNPLGSKALIWAACEIQELSQAVAGWQNTAGWHPTTPLVDPDTLLNEKLEGSKYTIIETRWGLSLLRNGEIWIDETQLELPELWEAVGRQLRELRARAAQSARAALRRG